MELKDSEGKNTKILDERQTLISDGMFILSYSNGLLHYLK